VNRVPTEKQHDMLLMLASGSAGLSWGRRDTEQLLRRGWVTAELRDRYYQWVRITPDGLRALAESVQQRGLPDLGPKPQTHRRVCADCGSTSYRTEAVDVEVAA
jgi:hypothetical protein